MLSGRFLPHNPNFLYLRKSKFWKKFVRFIKEFLFLLKIIIEKIKQKINRWHRLNLADLSLVLQAKAMLSLLHSKCLPLLLLLFLFAFFEDASCDGTWSLTKCTDPISCSTYIQQCMLYFVDIANTGRSSRRCQLFPPCAPGYELMTDVNLNMNQVCLRSDIGGNAFYTMGDYVTPTHLIPFTSISKCVSSIRENGTSFPSLPFFLSCPSIISVFPLTKLLCSWCILHRYDSLSKSFGRILFFSLQWSLEFHDEDADAVIIMQLDFAFQWCAFRCSNKFYSFKCDQHSTKLTSN